MSINGNVRNNETTGDSVNLKRIKKKWYILEKALYDQGVNNNNNNNNNNAIATASYDEGDKEEMVYPRKGLSFSNDDNNDLFLGDNAGIH
jgi:hypothetical protein